MEFRVERREGIELWTIDGESRRNAISRAMLNEFLEHLSRAASDTQLRCVILTGAGDKAFCAGADLKERATMSAEDVQAFHKSLRTALLCIEAAPQPFVAALNGAALGGGLEIALACDVRIASEGAQLGLPEVSLGIIPGGGATARLPRLIGLARAKDLILTARRCSAAEALAFGLVTRTVAPEKLLPEAKALAAQIARNAPVSLRQAKRALDGGFNLPLLEALELENQLYQACLASLDRKEALRAFAEKRAPLFRGE